jgi:hypothetical protein
MNRSTGDTPDADLSVKASPSPSLSATISHQTSQRASASPTNTNTPTVNTPAKVLLAPILPAPTYASTIAQSPVPNYWNTPVLFGVPSERLNILRSDQNPTPVYDFMVRSGLAAEISRRVAERAAREAARTEWDARRADEAVGPRVGIAHAEVIETCSDERMQNDVRAVNGTESLNDDETEDEL